MLSKCIQWEVTVCCLESKIIEYLIFIGVFSQVLSVRFVVEFSLSGQKKKKITESELYTISFDHITNSQYVIL